MLPQCVRCGYESLELTDVEIDRRVKLKICENCYTALLDWFNDTPHVGGHKVYRKKKEAGG